MTVVFTFNHLSLLYQSLPTGDFWRLLSWLALFPPFFLAMVVNAVQEPHNVFVLDSIVHFSSVPATVQDAFVLHHIELLTRDGLLAAQSHHNIADTHFLCLQQFDYLQPNRMG